MGNQLSCCGKQSALLDMENPGRRNVDTEEFLKIKLSPIANGPDDSYECEMRDVVKGKKAVVIINMGGT